MKRRTIYALAVPAFALIAGSAVVAAMGDTFPARGYTFLLTVVPLVLLFMAMIAMNSEIAVPLLLRHRYRSYLVVAMLMAVLIPMASLGLEYIVRLRWGVPQRVDDWLSPWLMLYAVTNGAMVFLIILGLGMFAIFTQWRRMLLREAQTADNLGRYIAQVRSRLNPDGMFAEIDAVLADMDESVERANSRIRRFCAMLRRQLYDLPLPAVPVTGNVPADHPVLAAFLTSRRYRLWRLTAALLILTVIASETFFEAPDRPVFSAENFIGVGTLLLIFLLLTAVTAGWLFRRFRRHGSLRLYVRDVCVLVVCMIVPMVLLQMLTYNRSPYSGVYPWPLALVSTLGSATALVLFLAGVSSVQLLRQWIVARRRMVLLKAETARQEYLFLRRQINPHFLFNVLNNIGILSEEDVGSARGMLLQLRYLLEYQFSRGERSSVDVAGEMEVIDTYLRLQSSRIEPFAYDIGVEGNIGGRQIPSLVLITFVENAVKHSSVVDGRRTVSVRVGGEKRGIRFRCENSYSPPAGNPSPTAAGGLGLRNTRRRLDLIYGDRYSLEICESHNIYSVNLFIPTI